LAPKRGGAPARLGSLRDHLEETLGLKSPSERGPVPHQHTSYKGLAKPALRMLNGFLTFYYGALNSSCYYGDCTLGGELPGLLLVRRTHGSYVDLAAGARQRGLVPVLLSHFPLTQTGTRPLKRAPY
jgi:hypothetical protein